MTWSDLYLICFLVGLLLSLAALVLGDLNLHVHLPFHLDLPHLDIGSADTAHATGSHSSIGFSIFNLATLTTFLACFGGIGYLLSKHSQLYSLVALGLALGGGVLGASIVFLVINRVFLRHEADYLYQSTDMVGRLGKITSSIFEGGTGEITYVQGGTRHSCAARTEDGTAIAKGTEVVVTRYEKGVAYVRTWEQLEARYGKDTGVEEKES
jgi:membrane protein implicated in regulation of membrane protease activity